MWGFRNRNRHLRRVRTLVSQRCPPYPNREVSAQWEATILRSPRRENVSRGHFWERFCELQGEEEQRRRACLTHQHLAHGWARVGV